MFKVMYSAVVFFAATAPVLGQGIDDTEPPTLLNLWVEPASIDCSFAEQVVTIHWEMSDDLVGDATSSVTFWAPTTQQHENGHSRFESGTIAHGYYSDDMTFPRYSEMGIWSLYSLSMEDGLGNRLSLLGDSLITYLSDRGIEPPTITVGPSAPEPSTWAMLALAACIFTSSRRVARAAYTRR